MKRLIFSLLAAAVLFVPAAVGQERTDNIAPSVVGDNVPDVTVVGAWNITYTLTSTATTRTVKFIAYSDHTGRFITGNPASTTTGAIANAVWDNPAPFFNFSGEVRIPLGNVGQETGTLAFKAFNGNTGLLECQVIYIENLLTPSAQPHYSVRTGTCVANPISPTP
jgi:hypothetical protein